MEVVEIGLSVIKWFKLIFITGSPRIHIKSDGVACDLLEIHLKCISSYVNIPTSHTQIENGAYFIDHGKNINIAELFQEDPERFSKFR